MSNTVALIPENCPHLGLHDDPSTALAYPSAWNYCYHARPPASVVTSHQVSICLTRKHVECPVYLLEGQDALPSELRGRLPVPARRAVWDWKSNRWVWILSLGAALLLIVWWGLQTFSTPPQPASTLGLPTVSTSVPSPTDSPRVESTNPAQTNTVSVKMSTQPASLTHDMTASPEHTSTIFPPVLPASALSPTRMPGTCGHSLDVSFGTVIRLVIHRVVRGESMDLYAKKYQTSQEAIRAVNFNMPLPLWADSVIVIPVGTSDVTGIPVFELYQASGETVSLEQLSAQLNADLNLLKKFNAFDDTCWFFVDWLLIPRSAN